VLALKAKAAAPIRKATLQGIAAATPLEKLRLGAGEIRPLRAEYRVPIVKTKTPRRSASFSDDANVGMERAQLQLFETDPQPLGFQYQPELLTISEEAGLIRQIERLPFKEFEFHGFLGKRRVVSYGWRYDFNDGGLKRTDPFPDFLFPVREKVGTFLDGAKKFGQVLITEYSCGAAIGWHKDRPVFGDVVGVSLKSACTLRFRRKADGGWERFSIKAEPRSMYLLSGPARSEWEHSIPSVDALRYSITFRTLKPKKPAAQRSLPDRTGS
jgi:alkylated DNA repair dioxygenase AlkB